MNKPDYSASPSIRDLGRRAPKTTRRPTRTPRRWRWLILPAVGLALVVLAFQACQTCDGGPEPDQPPPDAAPPDSWPVPSFPVASKTLARKPAPPAPPEPTAADASPTNSFWRTTVTPRAAKKRRKKPRKPPAPGVVACTLRVHHVVGLQLIGNAGTDVAQLFTFLNPRRICGQPFALFVERNKTGLFINAATLGGIDVCMDFSTTILELSSADGRFRHHDGRTGGALYFPKGASLRVCNPSKPMSKHSLEQRRPRQVSSPSAPTESTDSPKTSPWTWPESSKSPSDSSSATPDWP